MPNQLKHTPGPWAFDIDRFEVVTGDDVSARIATVDADNAMHETALADLKLIAAAPDMLAALRSAELAVEELCQGQDNANQCWVVLREIRDAIQLATTP